MNTGDGSARRGLVAGVALGLSAWALLAGLVLLGATSARAAFDAEMYHLAVIRTFAATWPLADVSDYLSATTPGYHWVLAGVWRLWPSVTVLEMIGSGVAAALVGVVGWWATRESRWGVGWVAALPVVASPYVVHSALAVLPDNAAWLCVLAVLLLSLGGLGGLRWVAVGLALLALVLARQSHIWAAGVIVASGWLGASGTLQSSRDSVGRKLGRAAAGGASAVPAVVALGLFVWIWGGLVPPTFAGQSGGAHPNVRASLSVVAPAYILMLIGLYAPFYAGWWWTGVRCRAGLAIVFGVAGALVGLGLAVAGASTFDLESGRNGGYWQVIRAGPVIADRTSVVLVVLSSWGGAMVGVCGAALPARRRLLLLITLAGFACAQVVNANAWQRYHEPMVLLLIAVASACCLRGEESRSGPAGPSAGVERSALRVLRVAGPVVLALGLAGLTATTLRLGV